jgi:hypothetical protein
VDVRLRTSTAGVSYADGSIYLYAMDMANGLTSRRQPAVGVYTERWYLATFGMEPLGGDQWRTWGSLADLGPTGTSSPQTVWSLPRDSGATFTIPGLFPQGRLRGVPRDALDADGQRDRARAGVDHRRRDARRPGRPDGPPAVAAISPARFGPGPPAVVDSCRSHTSKGEENPVQIVQRRLGVLVPLLGLAGAAGAAPVQWSGNGHYYDMIVPANGITWTDARAAAANSTYNGLPGHLVTFGSQAEWDFVYGAFPRNFTWIGFTDEQSEGTYKWVTGEPVTFTAWLPFEPNNSADDPPGEDYAWYENRGGIAGWNDYQNFDHPLLIADPIGYAVEYEGAVPEPASLVTLSSALTVILGFLGRGRRTPRPVSGRLQRTEPRAQP